jgi:hypothetical protein
MTKTARMLFEEALQLDPLGRNELVSMLLNHHQRQLRRSAADLALATDMNRPLASSGNVRLQLVSWEEILDNLYLQDQAA